MPESFYTRKSTFFFFFLFISSFQILAQDTFSGNVFLDHNKDGIKNFSDYNHPVINIKAYDDTNGDGVFNAGDLLVKSDLTDAFGNYFLSLDISGGSVRDSIFVQTGSDDAEENVSTGAVGLTSSDLEMADEGGSTPQKVGIRFNRIGIPAGVNITNAYIRFEAKQSTTLACNLNITAEKSIISATFDGTDDEITARDTTTASISWTPGDWADNSFYTTPDLTAVVSELVNQSGWDNSSAVTFIITGEGEREAWSENGTGTAPELVVEYDNPYLGSKIHIVLEETELANGSEISIPAASNYYTYDTGLGATTNVDFAFQGEVVLCYGMSDGGDDSGLSAMNRMTGEDLLIGIATGANGVEASCFHPITSQYYAANENQLGIVNTTTGSFTPKSNTFGIGGHSTLPDVTFDDVDGLAFDPLNGELWGTHRRGGRDVLIKIDTITGAHIPEAFGTGNDYVVIADLAGNLPSDIDDIAIDPDTRKLYGVANESGLDILVEIDYLTGTAVAIDTLQYTNGTNVGDVEGFGFTNFGLLLAITGNNSTKAETQFTVDLNTAIVTEVGTYDYGDDYESCDCLTAAPNNLSGNVWNDINGNQIIEGGENGLAGVTIYLYNDLNNNGKIDGSDILFDSTDTNVSGFWSYSSGANVDFIFIIDTDDLPGGSVMTTNNLEYALFSDEIGGATDSDNNFGYNSSGPDSDHDGIFDSVDVDDDNDGIPDVIENYALDSDGDGIPDPLDLDADDDGIPDLIEAGGVDIDGDGRIDSTADIDGDGLMGIYDNDDNDISTITSSLVPGGNVKDTDSDGLADYIDLDADNDGIPDLVEAGGIDTDGNGLVDIYIDDDGDGYTDIYDSDEDDLDGDEDMGTPIVETDGTGKMFDGATGLDKDVDNDGYPDHLDLDADNDGIPDLIEAGGTSPNNDGMVDVLAAPWDSDNDGLVDIYDENNSGTALVETTADTNNDQRVNNSESMSAGNTNQINIDGDPYPNHLDLDADNDGITDVVENAGGAVTADNSSGNLDGIVGDNPMVTDSDNDGWHDPSNTSTTDSDGDGLPDFLDIDADNDGIVDYLEGVCSTCPTFTNPTGNDTNENGVLDMYENLTSGNANAGSNIGTTPNEDDDDGTNPPDYLDTDTDEDGAYDWTEGYDLNNNGVADDDIILMATSFETATSLGYYTTTDSDTDGIPDWLDNQPLVSGYDENVRPPFLDQNSSFWKDDNNNGLVALFDASENGTAAPTPDNNGGNDNDWRDMTSLVALPVELTRFEGIEKDCEVKLTWHAAVEEKFDSYQIQWSGDGYDFKKVINVEGKGGTDNAYSFIHKDASTHNYYRLKMVDLDGSVDLSKVIYIKSNCEIDIPTNIYPNPMAGEANLLNVEFKSKNVVTQISIFDMTGRMVHRSVIDTSIGEMSKMQFDFSHLAVGTYNLIISGEEKSNIFIISE
ncbi:MAG: T9SS type A sorting domain-containing protein [Saprospiraceae bacterium]